MQAIHHPQVILQILAQHKYNLKTRYTVKCLSTDDFCRVWFAEINLWAGLETDMSEARRARNATADATVEVQRYITEPPLERSDDPLA